MKKFVSDTLFITAAGFINKAKGVIFIPFIISMVGLANYGAFVQILITRMFKSFFSLELGMGFQRFASQLKKDDTRELGLHFYSILLPTFVLGALGTLLWFLSAYWLDVWFFEGKHLETVQVASLIILSGCLYSNLSKYLLCRKLFKPYSVLSFFYEFLPYLGFIAGIGLYKDLFWGVVYYVIVEYMVVLATFFYLAYGIPVVRPSRLLFKKYVQYTYPLVFSSIEGGMLSKSDRYFISYFIGIEAVGIYNIIYKICDVIGFIVMPIRKQVMSYLAKSWDKGYHNESIAVIRNTLLLFSSISIGLIVFLMIYLHSMLELFLDKAIEIEYLVPAIGLIGVGVAANSSKDFFYLLVRLGKNTLDEFWYQLAGLVPNVMLNFLLVPHYGILGSAIATFTSHLIILLLINRKYSLRIDRTFLRYFGLFILVSAVMLPVEKLLPANDSNALMFMASAALAGLSYLLLLLLVGRGLLLDMQKSFREFNRLKYS